MSLENCLKNSVSSCPSREDKGVREWISQIGPIPIVIPCNKIYISKRYFFWVDKHFFFFSFDICVTRSFRNRHKISHNTKSKIWRQLCDLILLAKNVKIRKIKLMKFYKMASSILLRKFIVISLKLNKLFEIWIFHHFC